jgi:hypothetical protein
MTLLQNFYCNGRSMNIGPQFPSVIKVGQAHASVGKVKIDDSHQFQDFASVLSMTQHYCTAEPFIDFEYVLRVQKIGQHYRAFTREYFGAWKTNTGNEIMFDFNENIETIAFNFSL